MALLNLLFLENFKELCGLVFHLAFHFPKYASLRVSVCVKMWVWIRLCCWQYIKYDISYQSQLRVLMELRGMLWLSAWLHLHTDYPKVNPTHLWLTAWFFTCNMTSLHGWITELAYWTQAQEHMIRGGGLQARVSVWRSFSWSESFVFSHATGNDIPISLSCCLLFVSY